MRLEVLLTDTLLSGQLYLRPPSQNAVQFLNSLQTLYFYIPVSSQPQLRTPRDFCIKQNALATHTIMTVELGCNLLTAGIKRRVAYVKFLTFHPLDKILKIGLRLGSEAVLKNDDRARGTRFSFF